MLYFIQMKKYLSLSILFALLFSFQSFSQQNINRKLLMELENQLTYFADKTDFPEKVARSYSEEEGYLKASYKDWTCGFPPGTMWYMYELTGKEKWKTLAAKTTEKLDGFQFRTNTHDLGFVGMCSNGNGYRLTGNENYKKVVLQASETLITRFDKDIGCIRSWDWGDWQYPVIIDNMMNLEMLFWASKETGDQKYKNIAISHADVTMKNHFRPDWSSWHVVSYDRSNFGIEIKQTHQGLNDDSAWGRGQAWGLYGFSVMFRETGDQKYLELASKIADFIIANLPEDKISYWDFNDPKIPNAFRDVSAASITASALFELGTFDVEKKELYLETANAIIESLNSKKYRANEKTNGGFLLMHSVGNYPKNSEIDVPINYADYYYLEALKRQNKISK